MKDLYTPCFVCTEVVREGSRRFAEVEPPGTNVIGGSGILSSSESEVFVTAEYWTLSIHVHMLP